MQVLSKRLLSRKFGVYPFKFINLSTLWDFGSIPLGYLVFADISKNYHVKTTIQFY